MLPVPEDKGESKRRVRFEGICADATKLGVSREHLYRVLIGQRVSQSLLRRYRELKSQGVQPEKPAGPEKAPATPPPRPAPPPPPAAKAKTRGPRKSNNN